MAENIIVGAGLAGMVAAIELARRGREVIVLEREPRVGGSPVHHPSPEGTPLDLGALGAYLGIDIGPAVATLRMNRSVVYGEMIPVDGGAISGYMIERGPGPGSLDSYLYKVALEEGVRFEFNQRLSSSDDFLALPPDSIIATGLHFEGFDSVGVPYRTSFHFTARENIAGSGKNHVTVYLGRFTREYGYTCSVNGIRFAHLFGLDPPGKESLKAFEEQVFLSEGLEFDEWNEFTLPVPAASIRTPRLFAGNKLLAGSLSGCQEPYMFFGMLGAMVSGRIAALAVRDRAAAFEEFRLATSSFSAAYILKKLDRMTPHLLRRPVLGSGLRRLREGSPGAGKFREGTPGWKNCARAFAVNPAYVAENSGTAGGS